MKTTILFVPGLRDHVADHWQTLLADELEGSRTVPPLEHDKLSCAARVAHLDASIREIKGPVILVAHSAGVMITAHWAQWHHRQIKGALLATPPDIERSLPPGYPTLEQLDANGWLPVPRRPLPFKSIVAVSANDPLAEPDRIVTLAGDWGSRLVHLGKVGHLNPASGFGAWRMAKALIAELDAEAVKAGA